MLPRVGLVSNYLRCDIREGWGSADPLPHAHDYNRNGLKNIVRMVVVTTLPSRVLRSTLHGPRGYLSNRGQSGLTRLSDTALRDSYVSRHDYVSCTEWRIYLSIGAKPIF